MRAAVLRDGRMVLRDDVAEPVPQTGPGARRRQGMRNLRFGPSLRLPRRTDGQADKEMTGMPIEGGLRVDLAQDVFMGHEFSAEVLEAGPDTDAPPPGTVVTSLPVLLSPKGFEPICRATPRSAAMPSGCCCRRRCY